jgi:glyoxylase-like metal-dependent hydrolase (beta-lactamase superfamily II)
MIEFGRFRISAPLLGSFRLDGGAMFGNVPKTLWSKRVIADEENRVRLATRSLLIRDSARTILVDAGLGDKWSEKMRQIYDTQVIPPSSLEFRAEEVTDVILTHLHFDHSGGLTRFSIEKPGELELCYPQAALYLQRLNWENAQTPNLRERASYLAENVKLLADGKLTLLEGDAEICPDIWVHPSNGHTTGLQWVEVRDGERSLVYPSDLIPTARHLAVPYCTGYDMHTELLLKEKEELLSQAMQKGWIIVFIHDMDIPAATVTRDERGHYAVKEVVGC